MRYPLAGLIAGALLTAAVAAPSATAAPSLRVTLQKLTSTQATVTTVCPDDPPQSAIISGDVGDQQFAGVVAITCDGYSQRVVIPLQTTLQPGTVVTDVQVTISGDSGDIVGNYDLVRVSRTRG